MKPSTAFLDRPIRFGIIGCGRISAKHIQALSTHSKLAEVVAVCDPDSSARKAASTLTGARGYESLPDLLAHSEAEVVTLCTPSGLHAAQAVLAANAGRHVVTEKPMATRWTDALQMVRACDENHVQLFVIKQNRRNPISQMLK